MKKGLLLIAVALIFTLVSFNAKEKTTYQVDVKSSTLKWTGYHLAKSYEHNGNVHLKSGNLEVENGKITGGNFVIDMTSITNSDLTDTKKNKKLVDDLKSERFFGIDNFPEAKLVINSVDGVKALGEITIREITEPISFDINISKISESKFEASAVLNINRIKHEVMYGWSIENAMLSNEFKMEIKIVANK